MTVKPHPVTGVEINSMDLIRSGRMSEDELRTASLLLAEGHPRWIVAAMLGRHPLTFSSDGRVPRDRRPRGSKLSERAARRDPRQIALEELLGGPILPDGTAADWPRKRG